MFLTRSEYDRGVNTFSPEGRLFQVPTTHSRSLFTLSLLSLLLLAWYALVSSPFFRQQLSLHKTETGEEGRGVLGSSGMSCQREVLLSRLHQPMQYTSHVLYLPLGVVFAVSSGIWKLMSCTIRTHTPWQVEYAIEAIKLGSTAIGIQVNDGVVLAVEKRITSPLMEPASIHKIVEIDTHIGESSHVVVVCDCMSGINVVSWHESVDVCVCVCGRQREQSTWVECLKMTNRKKETVVNGILMRIDF